jgi:hypothetical protein
MAASHCWMSPRSSGPGIGIREPMSGLRRGGRGLEVADCCAGSGAWVVAGLCFRRVDEKGRRMRPATAGTRNSEMVQDAAVLELDTRKAWISALRTHRWPALIDV